MTRHPFANASGFVLAMLLATTALAQGYQNQGSPTAQPTGVRPGWSRDGLDPANSRARYTVSPAPVQMVDSTSGTGRSFLPSWLGWGNKKQAPQGGGKTGRTNPNNLAGPQRNAGNGSANMPPDPSTMPEQGEAKLPGLGGSPLPRKANQSNSAGTSGKPTNTTAPLPQPRVTKSKPQSANDSPSSGVRTASRQPLTPSTKSSTGNSPTTSATRNSPGRRTAPHISADELRRELSGTFNTPSASEATPRTAQADASLDGNTSSSKSKQALEDDAVISDSPITLPAADDDGPQMPAVKSSPTLRANAAQRPADSVQPRSGESLDAAQNARSAFGANSSVRIPFSASNTPQTARGKEAFGEALQIASGGDPNVLASNQTPVLTADIRGPKQILVGREAVYRVRLQNQSDIPAEGIVAIVKVPSGAEVMNTSATQGIVQASQDGSSKGQLQWQLPRVDRRGAETLEIRLIPRESRPLELGVSWTLAAVGSRAIVEVQEAKLQLEIAGPNEVLFDRPQVFKLTISNPGTGTAESVKIELLPPGGEQSGVSSHPLGDLAPGASQTVEVKLTPREAGKMTVKAIASAEGGLSSDAAKDVFCRKPELEVDWRGPATKYAGTMATYFIRVRNPGTAPAEDVTIHAALPDGAEFTSASEGQSYDAERKEVSWRVGSLGPGDDNYMEIKCVLKSPGTNRMKIAADSATAELAVNKVAETNVIAIADLKLEVSDPSGPVAVGSQVVYEIRVNNRGASAAKDINIVALFSEGIEPEQADGAMYTVSDGRVSFRPIEELGAGRDIVLRIRAHALQPGTHVFRAEVLCRDLEIKLAAEETTRFYADDSNSEGEQPSNQAASRSEAFESTLKK